MSRFLTALQHIIGYSVPYKLLNRINFSYNMSGNVTNYNYVRLTLQHNRWKYTSASNAKHNLRFSILVILSHFPVLHIPPLHFSAAFSSPVFSFLAFSASPVQHKQSQKRLFSQHIVNAWNYLPADTVDFKSLRSFLKCSDRQYSFDCLFVCLYVCLFDICLFVCFFLLSFYLFLHRE